MLALDGFWNDGSPELLKKSLSPDLFDHALPPGWPQGPVGVSKGFLAAVPDLVVTVVQQVVAVDRVASPVRLTGHFTGKLGDTRGKGPGDRLPALARRQGDRQLAPGRQARLHSAGGSAGEVSQRTQASSTME